MKPEDRRRFAAVAALVLGVFLALTLVTAVPTGPIGRGLGDFFWRVLGAGAVGLPLLGLGLGLAGFDRIPRLDMKRADILLGGLALLVPFTLGVLTNATAAGFDPPLPEWQWPARLTGIVPGFAARGVVAVPVGARETWDRLAAMADDVICASTPDPFAAVGLWYADFSQTTDDEVRALLA